MPTGKIVSATCIIIITAVTGLAFSIPFLSSRPLYEQIGVYAAAGILISIILSVITASIMKSAAKGKVEKEGLKEEAPSRTVGKAHIDEKVVQVLSLLQKKGRFIDFLQEDVSAYEDSQIGAAVRNIHKGCREAVSEYMKIEPVMRDSEGNEVTVGEGFDPSAVRVTGNVAGGPPFRGVLRHSGWRVTQTGMPPLPEKQDLSIIEPAEVEVV
jgi:hypothetical protein